MSVLMEYLSSMFCVPHARKIGVIFVIELHSFQQEFKITHLIKLHVINIIILKLYKNWFAVQMKAFMLVIALCVNYLETSAVASPQMKVGVALLAALNQDVQHTPLN